MNLETTIKDTEFFYWCLLPAVIGLLVLTKSIITLSKKLSFTNWILTLIITLFSIFSEYWLFVIFFMGAWPTYIPHVGIGLALIIYGVQFFANRNIDDKKNTDTSMP